MLVSMSGHHFPPDPCAPGLHVQGRGVCPGGGAPRPAQDRRGAQGEHEHEHHPDPGVDHHDNNVHDGRHQDDSLYISILR